LGSLGLLLCDHVRPELIEVSGDYPEMIVRFIPGFDVEVFDVVAGHWPASVSDCDAWLVSGSRHSVNDDLPWIPRLESFVRKIADEGPPYLGICFGHQLLATALGGSVVRAGWRVGIKAATIRESRSWMAPALTSYRVLYSHSDQVRHLPEGAAVLASSSECPVEMFEFGPRMLAIQGHPEFSVEYAEALMNVRREIPADVVEAAMDSLDCELHSGELAAWIARFLG